MTDNKPTIEQLEKWGTDHPTARTMIGLGMLTAQLFVFVAIVAGGLAILTCLV